MRRLEKEGAIVNSGDHDGQDPHSELLERLKTIAGAVDQPPPGVMAAARAAFTWRTMEAELAELVYDSRLDDQSLAGVRAGDGPRRLVFEGPGLTLEVEVEGVDGGARQLVGQVVPPRPGVIDVRHAEHSLSVPVDQLGRFAVQRLPAGHISLRCRAEGVPTIDTAWVVAW